MQINVLLQYIFESIKEFGACGLDVNGVRKLVASVDMPVATGESLKSGFRINFHDETSAELWLASDLDLLQLPKCHDCGDTSERPLLNRCKICRELAKESSKVQPNLFNQVEKP